MPRPRRAHRFALTAPLAVILALSAAQLFSLSDWSCVDFLAYLHPGGTQEVATDEPAWIELNTRGDHVYRVDVAGSDDAALELWEIWYDSGHYCGYLGSQQWSEEISNGTASVEWTATGGSGILVTPTGEAITQTYTFHLEEIAAPPEGRVPVIPAVAHAPGVGGTFFRTDLRIFSPLPELTQAELVFVPTRGGAEQRASITVNPQEILALDDVVLSLFGLDNATGALRIEGTYWNNRIVYTSRTYNTASTGTFGQFIPAQSWHTSAGVANEYYGGPNRVLLHLAKSEDLRSNVGFVEVIGLDASIELEMVDDTGATVASQRLSLPAFSHRQINDIFTFLGAPDLDNVSLNVSVLNNARVFPYASVVDNHSSDPIYIPGLAERDAEASLWVPAAAAVDGAHNTRWRTDLRILPVDSATTVRISFFPSDGTESTTGVFPFFSSGVLAIDDVVGSLGVEGSGALYLFAVDGVYPARILATSRTYNVTARGSFGQFIPAETDAGAVAYGIALGAQRSEGYRTNVGMLNPSAYRTVDVEVSLVSGTGALLGSRVVHLAPRRHRQIYDIFSNLSATWQENCRVDFEVLEPNYQKQIFAYISVIDNTSGDPVYVPAAENHWGLDPRIELDNRDNALLMDELPEAVGVDLPEGTLTATVSGEGDLGRPDLPIHVLCMFKSPAGELRTASLMIGDSVSEVAGGNPFWCVIPDWINRSDNSGQVTVSLTGGAEEIEIELDAQTNAVLLDELTESVVATRPPREAYELSITGDLGRPELTPQVVTMNRDAETGRLRVRALTDGDIVDRIETDFQLLVVVADWISRADNTGTTVLEEACTTRTSACNSTITGSISGTDCRYSPVGYQHRAERVTFEGSSGQVVTITTSWNMWADTFYLVDPGGQLIAESADSPDDQSRSVIADLTLEQTGTYEIWVVRRYGSEDYTVEIICDDP